MFAHTTTRMHCTAVIAGVIIQGHKQGKVCSERYYPLLDMLGSKKSYYISP